MDASHQDSARYQWSTETGAIVLERIAAWDARPGRSSAKREMEQAAVRTLVSSVFPGDSIAYKDSGQPVLKNNPEKHLSISHANGWVALYVADMPVGIDVEAERTNMFEGRSYFVNEREEYRASDSLFLRLIWGVKEAFYKKQEGQITDLKNEVTIIDYKREEGTVTFDFQQMTYTCHFKFVDEMLVVYT